MSETSARIKQNVKNRIDPDALRAQQCGTTDPVGTPNNPSHKLLTVANVITFCRLFLTIAFLVVFVQRTNRYLALSFYVIAAVTDFLDGQVARRTQTVSWLGKIMDPLMDRILLFTGVLSPASFPYGLPASSSVEICTFLSAGYSFSATVAAPWTSCMSARLPPPF